MLNNENQKPTNQQRQHHLPHQQHHLPPTRTTPFASSKSPKQQRLSPVNHSFQNLQLEITERE